MGDDSRLLVHCCLPVTSARTWAYQCEKALSVQRDAGVGLSCSAASLAASLYNALAQRALPQAQRGEWVAALFVAAALFERPGCAKVLFGTAADGSLHTPRCDTHRLLLHVLCGAFAVCDASLANGLWSHWWGADFATVAPLAPPERAASTLPPHQARQLYEMVWSACLVPSGAAAVAAVTHRSWLLACVHEVVTAKQSLLLPAATVLRAVLATVHRCDARSVARPPTCLVPSAGDGFEPPVSDAFSALTGSDAVALLEEVVPHLVARLTSDGTGVASGVSAWAVYVARSPGSPVSSVHNAGCAAALAALASCGRAWCGATTAALVDQYTSQDAADRLGGSDASGDGAAALTPVAGDDVLEEGQRMWYSKPGTPAELVVVEGVHHDASPPYYTVSTVDGTTRGTERGRLYFENPTPAPSTGRSTGDGGKATLVERSAEYEALARLAAVGVSQLATPLLKALYAMPRSEAGDASAAEAQPLFVALASLLQCGAVLPADKASVHASGHASAGGDSHSGGADQGGAALACGPMEQLLLALPTWVHRQLGTADVGCVAPVPATASVRAPRRLLCATLACALRGIVHQQAGGGLRGEVVDAVARAALLRAGWSLGITLLRPAEGVGNSPRDTQLSAAAAGLLLAVLPVDVAPYNHGEVPATTTTSDAPSARPSALARDAAVAWLAELHAAAGAGSGGSSWSCALRVAVASVAALVPSTSDAATAAQAFSPLLWSPLPSVRCLADHLTRTAVSQLPLTPVDSQGGDAGGAGTDESKGVEGGDSARAEVASDFESVVRLEEAAAARGAALIPVQLRAAVERGVRVLQALLDAENGGGHVTDKAGRLRLRAMAMPITDTGGADDGSLTALSVEGALRSWAAFMELVGHAVGTVGADLGAYLNSTRYVLACACMCRCRWR